MPFLTLSNSNIQFTGKKLTKRFYPTAKTLPTTKRVELINKKKFAKATMDENVKAFVVHVISLSLSSMSIYPAREAQISSLVSKAINILNEYSDFLDVFLEEKALLLPELTELNQYATKLQDGKQPYYGLIYSLKPVEFKTLMTYIETNQANGFL